MGNGPLTHSARPLGEKNVAFLDKPHGQTTEQHFKILKDNQAKCAMKLDERVKKTDAERGCLITP